jgi:hypothetical protein
MLHDYWKYRPDAEFVKGLLPGERQVLSFFKKYQQPDGSLKNTPYWNFTDWAKAQDGTTALPHPERMETQQRSTSNFY